MFRFAHTNLNITDPKKSLEFYEKALGLTVVREKESADQSFHLYFLSDDEGKYQLELTWLRDKAGQYDLGDNEGHIAFATENMEEAHRLHEEMGVICYENEGMGIYFINDPDGYWLEIIPAK